MKAARSVVAAVRAKKPTLVQSVELLCDAYIDLAYHNVEAYKKSRGVCVCVCVYVCVCVCE